MRVFNIKPKSENNININALNGLFRSIFGFERYILRFFDTPFGVSLIVVAEKKNGSKN
ncbi:MAG: hypothetical protein KatS3mg006_2261 [Pyrinomonadaceae bacterium]|jgi:hypothetical protein|nr:MAG: hypothetical protein KatS3mg006_2261 [Pyrinomonadaceae bacterium]